MMNEPVIVRKAQASDAEGIARVHIASSDDSYAPLAKEWPMQDLSTKAGHWSASLQRNRTDSARVDLVATLQGVVVGFISGGPARRSEIPAQVEVYVVHVLPQHRRRGVGGKLWDLACTTIRGPALSALYVDTLAELQCCRFYESHGGELLTRAAGTFHEGAVTHVVYVWRAGKLHTRSV